MRSEDVKEGEIRNSGRREKGSPSGGTKRRDKALGDFSVGQARAGAGTEGSWSAPWPPEVALAVVATGTAAAVWQARLQLPLSGSFCFVTGSLLGLAPMVGLAPSGGAR